MNLSIFDNARIDEVFKDFVSFATTKKCKSLSNKGKPKSSQRQRCFVFPHQALGQQIPPTKNSKNYYYNPHTWHQWNTKHIINVAIWMDPRTHFNLCYQVTCLSQWKKINMRMILTRRREDAGECLGYHNVRTQHIPLCWNAQSLTKGKVIEPCGCIKST